MGRTNLAKARARALRVEFNECLEKRNKISSYLKKLEEDYDSGKVSYERYQLILNKNNKGKTLGEWVSHYDEKLFRLKNSVDFNKKEKLVRKFKKAPLVIFSVLLVFAFALVLIFGKGSFLGFAILGQDQGEKFTQDIGLSFSENTLYHWIPAEQGKLTSFKISGVIEGVGEVRVYLDDYLVYEKFPQEEQKKQKEIIPPIETETNASSNFSENGDSINETDSNETFSITGGITGAVVGTPSEPGMVMYAGGFLEGVANLFSNINFRITGFTAEGSEETPTETSNSEEIVETVPLDTVGGTEDTTSGESSETTNAEISPSQTESEASSTPSGTTEDTQIPTSTESIDIPIDASNSEDTTSEEVSTTDAEISPSQPEETGENQETSSTPSGTIETIDTTSNSEENQTEGVSENQTNAEISPSQIENETSSETSGIINESEISINESTNNSTDQSYSEENKTTEGVSENQTNAEISPSLNETLSETSGEGIAEEISDAITRFIETCDETCDLSRENLTKGSYTIRIEIDNALFYLDKIDYTLFIEELNNQTLNDTNLSNVVSVKQYPAFVNESVKWEKIIEVENEKDELSEVEVDVEDIAENISVEVNDYEDLIKAKNVGDIENSFVNKKESKEKNKVKNVTLRLDEKNTKKYNVTYETPGPEQFEQNISKTKKIVNVTAPMEYDDVLIETELPVPIKNKTAQVKRTGNKNEIIPKENITFIDENNDGMFEKISWNVSNVVNESFEIDLVILNPLEYLRDGDTWEVRFTTVGVGNLSIWSENSRFEEMQLDLERTMDEMRFLNLSCGNVSLKDRLIVVDENNVSYRYSGISNLESIQPYKFVINDYSCEDVGRFKNYMNVGGYAVLDFEFANEDVVIRQQAVDPSFNESRNDSFGYEFLNMSGNITNASAGDILHIWNVNDDYFFNKTAGIQLTNHFQDYWTRNVFCIGYYNNLQWNVIKCADEVPEFNRMIETDNSTYINATLWNDFTYGGYDFRFGVRYHLKPGDENLSVVIFGQNMDTVDIPFPLGFAWRVKDWEIPVNVGDDDILINGTVYPLNGTYNIRFRNMTVETGRTADDYDYTPFFMGTDDSEYLRLDWNENLNYSVWMQGDGAQENFSVTWLVNAGLFSAGQQKSTTLNWIDAELFLQDANTEVLDDDDTNYAGSTTYIYVNTNGGTYEGDAYVKFNISNLNTSLTIDYAEFCHTILEDGTGGSYPDTIEVYGISNYTWTEEVGSTTSMRTSQGTLILQDSSPSFTLDEFYCFNVSDWVRNETRDGRQNVTFGLLLTDASPGDSDDSYYGFYPKESGTAAYRPYLNVTYDFNGSPTLYNLSIINPTTSNPKSVSDADNITVRFNFTVNDVNQTSGVTIGNVFIGGEEATIKTVGSTTNTTDRYIDSVWGFDCGSYSESDNTYDSCTSILNNGGDNDEIITNLRLNVTTVYPGDRILVSCMKTSGFSGDDQQIAYRNSTTGTWKQIQTWTSSWNDDTWYTTAITVDNVIGEHQIRCSVTDMDYSGTLGTCVGGEYFDNDDINLTVVAAYSQEFLYYNSSWNVNVTVPSGLSGGQDLFLNATYGGTTRNDTQTSAITYSGGIDSTVPQINLETPANNTLNTTDATPGFIFNFVDYYNETASCTLYVDNGTTYNLGFNGSTINDTSTAFASNMTLSNMDYWWWVNCTDGTNENKSEIRNLTINFIDLTFPQVNLETPVNNTVNTTDNTPGFIFNFADDYNETALCKIYVDDGRNLYLVGLNGSTKNDTSTTINSNTTLASRDYWWWVNCTDGTNENKSEIRNLSINFIDLTVPQVNLESPTNNTINTTDRNPGFTFNFVDYYDETAWCSLYVDNGVVSLVGLNDSTKNATSTTINSNTTLTNTDYWWWVNCTDGTNENKSEVRNLSMDVIFDFISIIDPTALNPKSVNDEDNITVKFNFSSVGVNQTSGVSIDTVLIGGEVATIRGGAPSPTNTTERYCSSVWGFDCAGPPGEPDSDNTYDSCANTNSGGVDEHISNLKLNVTTAHPGDTILVSCMQGGTPWSGNRNQVSYRNSTTAEWKQINVWDSAWIGDTWYTTTITLDDVLGEQQVRCSVVDTDDTYNLGTCVSGTYFDNDDMNFTVVEGSTQQFGYYDASWNVNVTVPSGLSGLQYLFLNASDLGSNINITEQNAIEYPDLTVPQVNLETPTNNTLNTTDATPGFIFNFVDYYNETASCTLYVDNGTTYNIGSNSSTINATSTTINSNLTLSNMEYWWWVNCTDGTNQNKSEVRNLTVNMNIDPVIYDVLDVSDVTLTIGPNPTFVIVNFSAKDLNGGDTLDDSSAMINLTKSGEETRFSSVSGCIQYEVSGSYANYTCNVTMWWFDINGDWNIYANISDGTGTNVINMTDTLTINPLTGFEMHPSSLSFPELTPGETNKTASEYLVLNNTGNQVIGSGNVQINASDLRGESIPGQALWAGNFSAGPSFGLSSCDGATSTSLENMTYVGIENLVLSVGNYTLQEGDGQDEMYFCLREVGNDLTEQVYSTANLGSWTVHIFLVALSIRRNRKKKKRRNYSVPISIFNKRLGALETLAKYMKENMNLTYHDIGEILNRDERTIWTACKKANEKQEEKIESRELKREIYLPMEIFEDRNFTPLESIINYLKIRGMKYSEIAELLDRDQRNIWTVYNRMKKKFGLESLESKLEDIKPREINSLNGYSIPASIFNKELGALESLTKYMKENLNLNYNEIAKELNRDQRTIWTSYKRANEKQSEGIEARKLDEVNEVYLPTDIFGDRGFTPLESAINYLKNEGMNYSEIAKLLDRDQRNVWTIYNRMLKKKKQ